MHGNIHGSLIICMVVCIDAWKYAWMLGNMHGNMHRCLVMYMDAYSVLFLVVLCSFMFKQSMLFLCYLMWFSHVSTKFAFLFLFCRTLLCLGKVQHPLSCGISLPCLHSNGMVWSKYPCLGKVRFSYPCLGKVRFSFFA